MRVQGEDILEEALDFSIKHLRDVITNSNTKFAAQVSNALKWPLRKALPRLKAREYISMYQEDPSHCENFVCLFEIGFQHITETSSKGVEGTHQVVERSERRNKFSLCKR